ncbi:MAG TPA: phospholipase D family protein [Hypericibacter adhaerens]|jgi:putative cardiolipin synthase|uniref:Phospholipase D n=1 Tax=Hypericibacter adhaerens TaxID=2602016 RepID=A0A5J6N4B0_9PROT|nr:phospholipase D family protein [Hypericibacter adhaerens]QEX24758.1 phospholipase D family protein [Hypericibacter adhaerens]HWA43739.1 phospholipase D family protein [Hypericibacter adhaerens]
MQSVLIALVALAGLILAAYLALLSYTRFLERARGKPSLAMPVSETAARLDRLVAPLLARRPGQSGMVLLASNLDAFAARLLAARQAERSLDLQYYLWHGDLTGRLLAHEVLQAADRGVRVRLLLDDLNARQHDRTYLALDAHPNIDVRLFNPRLSRHGLLRLAFETVLRVMRITRRMHNKAWIADGRLAVVGGRNVGDPYFDAAASSNFCDLDLLMLGPAVHQAETVFDLYWNSEAAIPIRALGKRRKKALSRLRRRLASLGANDAARPYLHRIVQEATIGELLSGKGEICWAEKASIVADPPEKFKGDGQKNWLMHALGPLLASARAKLEIISPYFIPGDAGTTRLTEMAGQGVEIAVLTNSLAATDVTAVHGAYARYRKALVQGGIRLFELKPYEARGRKSIFGSISASLHTKAFTIDDRLGFVGSMNFDPRSASLNTEMGLLFEHEGLVRQIGAIFADETSPRKSYRVRIEAGRILWQDEEEGAVRTWRDEPEAPARRRLMATIIALLPIQSQL